MSGAVGAVWSDGVVIRAVLFDLDDTLMDHQSAADRAVVVWAAELGLSDDAPTLTARWTDVSNRHYLRFQQRELTAVEQQRARVREFLPHLDLRHDAAAEAVFDDYVGRYRSAWTAFADARPALERARSAGLRVGVLTNGEERFQRGKLARGRLEDVVDEFVASSTLPWSKPDARAFHTACGRLGTDPSETLMVGDSLANDVHGARGADLPAVLLDRHDAHRDADLRGAVRVRSLDDVVSGWTGPGAP